MGQMVIKDEILSQLKTLYKVQDIVEKILIEDKETRDNDKLLYYYVCKDYCEKENINIDKISLESAMFDDKIVLPNMETVRRTRQKLQEHNPALWGEKRFLRMANQTAYREYAMDNEEMER